MQQEDERPASGREGKLEEEEEEEREERHQELIVQTCLVEHMPKDPQAVYLANRPKPFYLAALMEENQPRQAESIKNLSDGALPEESGLGDEDPAKEEEKEKKLEIGKIQHELQEVADYIDVNIAEDKCTKADSRADVDAQPAPDPPLDVGGDGRPAAADGEPPPPAHGKPADRRQRRQTVDVVACLGPSEAKLSGEAVCEFLGHPAVLVATYLLACVHSHTGLDLLSIFGVLLAVVSYVSIVLSGR